MRLHIYWEDYFQYWSPVSYTHLDVYKRQVLGNALVCEIDLAVCIYSYVLKKSISSDCVVDIWLRILIQVDNLSICLLYTSRCV